MRNPSEDSSTSPRRNVYSTAGHGAMTTFIESSAPVRSSAPTVLPKLARTSAVEKPAAAQTSAIASSIICPGRTRETTPRRGSRGDETVDDC